MPMRLHRSVLYVPASNVRALQKARNLDADALIIDLEDSVAPNAKDAARQNALDALDSGDFGHREVAVRVNSLDSPWGRRDLEAFRVASMHAVVVPKVGGPEDIEKAASLLAGGTRATPQLWAMMESPLAILRAHDIARAASACAMTCMIVGTNDLAKDTRVALAPGRLALTPWIMTLVAAARAYGLDILDGVYNHIDDAQGFELECRQGRDFGMDGKTLIHPGQIAACNRLFSPSEEETAWARKVVDAFDDPANRMAGVLRVDGKMVEQLHAAMARDVLARVAAIAAPAPAPAPAAK